MSKKLLIIIPLLIMAGIIMASCGGGGSAFECDDELGCVTYAPDEPIRIASALVISGANAQLGLDSQYGVEIAIGMRGPVDGHEVELQAEDEGCNAEGGQAAGQKIVSDPTIVAVVGTSCSGAGVPMAEVISEAGYAMVSPSNTSPMLTDPEQAWKPGYLRTAHNDKIQGAAMANYAYNVLGVRKAALIHDGDPYTSGLVDAFENAFVTYGGESVEKTAINKGDTDMRPVLTSISAKEPDFLYYPLFTAECAFVTQQAKEVAGLENVTLASADGCFSDAAAEAIGDAGEGMYFSGPDLSFAGSLYEEFLVEYMDRYGSDPLSVFHAHSFDATNMIFDCVEDVGVQEEDGTLHIGRQALRDCLYDTSGFNGITGTLSCDQYGDCADPQISVSELQGGEYVRIWP